jgi:hypothetical protein
MQLTKYIRRGGFWMLDAVFLTILSPYISDIWRYITNPSLATGLKVIVFIVGIVAFAIFTFYLLMRRWGMLKGEQKETSVDVFSHSNLPRLEEIFSKVNRTVHLLGITLESLNPKIPTIEKILRNNKHVRILICHPKSPIMKEIEDLVVSTNTTSRIEATIAMLNNMREKLDESQKNNLEIRTYSDIPTHSMIIVDPDTSSGFF